MVATFVRCRNCAAENRVYGSASESRCRICTQWLYDDDAMPVSQNLHELMTYKRTLRLIELVEADKTPLAEDVLALWSTYCEGAESAGTPPSLFEFAAWLMGDRLQEAADWYNDVPPAEVIW